MNDFILFLRFIADAILIIFASYILLITGGALVWFILMIGYALLVWESEKIIAEDDPKLW